MERKRLIESLRPWLGNSLLVMEDEDPLLSSREVALLFRVCAATVRRWADTGRLEALRTPGGRWKFPVASVRRALASFDPDGHAAPERRR
jgi:excisionase family DNA binding protein